MKFFNWLFDLFDSPITTSPYVSIQEITNINPATGLPMVGGGGGLDILGNPFGINRSLDHMHSHAPHDSFLSGYPSTIDDHWHLGFNNDWNTIGGVNFTDL